MYTKKLKPSTDPQLRSLLQKAVRRGSKEIVNITVKHLIDIGDKNWLRSCSVIITFEEAWPLAKSINITKCDETLLQTLLKVTKSIKQKDAAGLGALSFAFHEGDNSMKDIVPSFWYLRMVSKALDQPRDFFSWALAQCKSESSTQLVNNAKKYLSSATWGWDKATVLAGALLATLTEIPVLQVAEENETSFPFWIALDKHTPDGKKTLRKISIEYGERYRNLIWAGFYFESTYVNELSSSPWFEAERKWRLRKAGLTVKDAKILWERIRPILESELYKNGYNLHERILKRENI